MRYLATTAGPQSFVASTRLRAPYAALATLLADPGDHDGGDGKISTSWMVKDTTTGDVFLVHDRQDEDDRTFCPAQFRARSNYAWHVAGPSDAALAELCRWLSYEVMAWARARGGRRLTAASRARIQSLVAEGKSVADATAIAAEWEPAIDPSGFAWPVSGPIDDP